MEDGRRYEDMDPVQMAETLSEIINSTKDSELHRKADKALRLGLYYDEEIRSLFISFMNGIDRVAKSEEIAKAKLLKQPKYLKVKTFIISELSEANLQQCENIQEVIELVNAALHFRDIDLITETQSFPTNNKILKDINLFPHRKTKFDDTNVAIVFFDDSLKVAVYCNLDGNESWLPLTD